MTDNARKDDSRNRGRKGGANDAMLSLADSIDDLQSILDTLDSLGIKDRDELIDYIEALEDELAQLESLDDAFDITHAEAIDREAERMMRAQGTDDHKEAVRAFVEKRKPVFKGR